MKRSMRILSVLLVLSMALALFASCGKKTGMVVAAYDGKPVYEGEIKNIVNYYVVSQSTTSSTQDEVNEIARDAVRTYVKYKVLEEDLKALGYVVDEKALKEELKRTIIELDQTFEGGYSDWRNMYQVDKDFLKEEVRRFMIADLFYKYSTEGVEVTDEVAKAYFNANGEKYMDPACYTWTAVLLEVKDINNEAELAKMKSEAEEYIRQINGGFTTLEKVKADILKKYTEEDGYSQTKLFSGENVTKMEDFTAISDLSAALDGIRETYGELDPSATAAENPEAYTKYRNYLAACYQAEVFYALDKTEVGKVFSNPIKSYAGYFIIRLDRAKLTNSFLKFEDVKDGIKRDIINQISEEALLSHVEKSLIQHNVQFLFDIEDEQTTG